MVNKVITGILVLLVVLMGGVGYYTYTVSQQIEALNGRLTAFGTAQTARVDAVSNEIIALRRETAGSISNLHDRIGETLAEIDNLEKEIGATQSQITGLEEEIGEATSQVESLEDRLNDAIAGISRSMIDASQVYQRVIQATVMITDGKNSIGSGLIFDTEGHVITNQHVAEDLSPIYVMLYDGGVYEATSISYCQFSDIAILQIQGEIDIEPPPLADSSQVTIGEPVVVIGSPFGLRDTLTSGIISQVNRFEEIGYDSENRWIPNLLQFDAAVNFGNSGGPLFNAAGEVIGIVVARRNPMESDGIYYAVSANKAKRVAEALIAKGFFDYPWIGIGIANLTPQIVQERDMETSHGVLVAEVFGDSPAEAGGIKVDDIIVSIDGVPVRNTADLTSYLGEFKSPGDATAIGVTRGTARLELSIEVGKRQE